VPISNIWLEGDQEASDLDGDSLPNDNCRSTAVSPQPLPPTSVIYAVVNKKATSSSGVSNDAGDAAVKPRLAPKPNRWKMASSLRTSSATDNIPLIRISQTESIERADKENEELLSKRFKAVEPLNKQPNHFDDLQEVVSEAGSGTIDQPATNTGMDEPSEPVKTVTFHTTQDEQEKISSTHEEIKDEMS